jgi:uncharacterized damage-inducible protein DinB
MTQERTVVHFSVARPAWIIHDSRGAEGPMKSNFAAVLSGEQTYAELAASLNKADLTTLTREYYAEIDQIITGVSDAAVVAVPVDPALDDQQAGEGTWTLGHVIAHLTATAEESAALASALARGADFPAELRLRSEIPWQDLHTAAAVRNRLAESERMTLAFLDTWPEDPDLDRTITLIPQLGPMNAIGRHLLGLFHANMHLDQLREIMRQLGSH